MAQPLEQDTPTHHIQMCELAETNAKEFLEGVRERRLKAINIYRLAAAEKQAKKLDKAKASAIKKIEMLGKKLETAEKNMKDIEKYVMQVQALRIEMGTLDLDIAAI